MSNTRNKSNKGNELKRLDSRLKVYGKFWIRFIVEEVPQKELWGKGWSREVGDPDYSTRCQHLKKTKTERSQINGKKTIVTRWKVVTLVNRVKIKYSKPTLTRTEVEVFHPRTKISGSSLRVTHRVPTWVLSRSGYFWSRSCKWCRQLFPRGVKSTPTIWSSG